MRAHLGRRRQQAHKHEKHALPLALRSWVVLTLPTILNRCKDRNNFRYVIQSK